VTYAHTGTFAAHAATRGYGAPYSPSPIFQIMAEQRERRAEERSHLMRFLEALPDSPPGSREFRDKPDLLISTPGHRIGIEHTQLIRKHESATRPFLKEAESLEDRCVDHAKEAFERRGGRPLFVYPHFNRRAFRKAEIEGLALQLAAAVEEILATDPAPQRHVEAWSFNRVALHPLPPQIEYLWVDDACGESLWGAVRADGVLFLDRDRIQVEINVKEAKVAGYRQECDEVWLLLVSHGFSPATELRLPENIGEERFASTFDRVFYFNNFTHSVVELRT
jgi:hypothetical protein